MKIHLKNEKMDFEYETTPLSQETLEKITTVLVTAIVALFLYGFFSLVTGAMGR